MRAQGGGQSHRRGGRGSFGLRLQELLDRPLVLGDATRKLLGLLFSLRSRPRAVRVVFRGIVLGFQPGWAGRRAGRGPWGAAASAAIRRIRAGRTFESHTAARAASTWQSASQRGRPGAPSRRGAAPDPASAGCAASERESARAWGGVGSRTAENGRAAHLCTPQWPPACAHQRVARCAMPGGGRGGRCRALRDPLAPRRGGAERAGGAAAAGCFAAAEVSSSLTP